MFTMPVGLLRTKLLRRQWAALSASGLPTPRGGVNCAEAAGKIVMFGGQLLPSGTLVGDTCVWDSVGRSWSISTPASSPGARYIYAMAYDEARSEVVMFGGYNAGQNNETWVLNVGTLVWTQKAPTHVPPGRHFCHMAYDANRSKIVLFGGRNNASALSDTWEWNGTDWTDVTPGGLSPQARFDNAIGYDRLRHRIVVHGGYLDFTGGATDDNIYEWDGTTWTQTVPVGGAVTPGARLYHKMVFDRIRNELTLFGGALGVGGAGTGVYTWNGATWHLLSAGTEPIGRAQFLFGWDGLKTHMFGGVTTAEDYDL